MKLSNKDKAKSKALYTKMVDKPYVPPTRLDIQATHLPAIKNMEVGKTHEIKIKAKMISKSEGGYDGKQPLRATFQIGGNHSDEAVDYDD